jgi:hypothetical protein
VSWKGWVFSAVTCKRTILKMPTWKASAPWFHTPLHPRPSYQGARPTWLLHPQLHLSQPPLLWLRRPPMLHRHPWNSLLPRRAEQGRGPFWPHSPGRRKSAQLLHTRRK